jgi:hypothetical protein
VTTDEDAASAGPNDPADRIDQRGLARAVGPEERKNLTTFYVQINIGQRLKSIVICFVERGNRYGGRILHHKLSLNGLRGFVYTGGVRATSQWAKHAVRALHPSKRMVE